MLYLEEEQMKLVFLFFSFFWRFFVAEIMYALFRQDLDAYAMEEASLIPKHPRYEYVLWF